MAEDTAKEAKPTEYRLLRKITVDGDSKALADLGLADGEELYALTPDLVTGNIRQAAYEKHGEGDYAQAASTSFKTFPVRVEKVVRFR